MFDAAIQVPSATNEPVLGYAPGTAERAALKAELARQSKDEVEIPCIIGGERVHTGRLEPVVMPHDHRHVIARFGRFPHRNAILGRATTPDEAAFLAQPGSSF